jgi:catechol 2,3-dioxygenase-like lactoylglutathione lyase family enzyme
MRRPTFTLRFDCIFYYVRDLEAAIRFYRDVLGFSLLSQDAVARFDVTGVLLELVPARWEDEPRGAGNARLCVKVLNLDEASRELRDRGVTVGTPHDVQGGRLATFNDLDGNELVLWQYSD